MIVKLSRIPYHIFLLPLFFIIHTCTVHWLYLSLPEFLLLAVKNIFAVVVIFSCLFLLLKNMDKAAIFTFLLFSINYFFPELQNLIRKYSPWSLPGRYIFLIPVLLLVVVLVFIRIRKTKNSFYRLSRYLSTLFLLMILIDISILGFRKFSPSVRKVSILNNDISLTPCKDCDKPDIYFLVFDEYSSSASLKEDYNYDNQYLDTFLLQKGFSIQSRSRSNYNVTAISSASILNMSYLDIDDTSAVTSIDYNNASRLTGNSQLASFLSQMGYDIINISLFDINQKKAPIKFYFSQDVPDLIMERTFLYSLFTEIGWNFFSKKITATHARRYTAAIQNIMAGIDTIKKVSVGKTERPKFVYGHLLMPHPPFLMDKTGPRTTEQIRAIPDTIISAYLDYVYYTNTVIKDLVTSIQSNSDGKAVIIIMSDHGFRRPTTKESPAMYFAIQNAVYFPGSNYSQMYDSISAVNQFRAVLNTIFNQRLRLLNDKQFYLIDRK